MENSQIHINWEYSGKPDAMFGTGATAREQALVWLFGLSGAAVLGWMAWSRSLPWAWWQYLIFILIALDVLGGVVANSLNACKRFYHAPIKPEETGFTARSKNHIIFAVFHIHTIIAGLVFGSMNWEFGIFWYLVMLASVVLVLRTPLYLQRPLAMGLIMTAILINQYIFPSVIGLEWLIPALFLKIVYGHVVREEPYRP
ncbi:MAG: hypothetical protein HS124_00720 [Anaerolineales bacterium]|nr:hypothetical protein [Anaerolineales bacterium]